MSDNQIFVGRQDELRQFAAFLEQKQGGAAIVVGQLGMGKTWLLNKMAKLAEELPNLKCGWVRYEVTPTDSVDSLMALMMDNAFEAASTEPGSFDKVPQRRKQWLALLKTFVPKGKDIAELVESLRRDPQCNTRDQFLERLAFISQRTPNNGRAIFIVDPEKYMQPDSDQSWAIVIKGLPEKIKFLFAQRPEDVLVDSQVISRLNNTVRIPREDLGILSEEDVDDLLKYRKDELSQPIPQLHDTLRKYNGHPYAIGASLDLLVAGVKLEELPERPEPVDFSAVQWKELCKRGKEAVRIFKAYAILQVPVPDEVMQAVSQIDTDAIHVVMADKYLSALFRKELDGKRIYHTILADYILEQMADDEKQQYHNRAIDFYRRKLKQARENQTAPDPLAAARLAEHVLQAEGPKAFVHAFINDCYPALYTLGLLDVAESLSLRAINLVEDNTEEKAAALGNLGNVYQTRGEFNKALEIYKNSLGIKGKIRQPKSISSTLSNLGVVYASRGNLEQAKDMFSRALSIDEQIGYKKGVAQDYGNIGNVYYTRGELDNAEDMYKKAVEIFEQIDSLKNQANQYGNLGNVYRARGDLDKAEEIYKKALEINLQIGRLEGQAITYGNLGIVYKIRGDLDKSEKMHKKALDIDEQMGNKQGMAEDYANLGIVYKKRGGIAKAREYWQKALALYKQIGMSHKVSKYENLLDSLDKK